MQSKWRSAKPVKPVKVIKVGLDDLPQPIEVVSLDEYLRISKGLSDEATHVPSHTLEHAHNADREGRLRQWAIDYLRLEGGNPKLAEHIEDHPDATVVYKETDLTSLKSMIGPDDTTPWDEDREDWDEHIEAIKESADNGYELPPLIVTDFWGELHLSDGSHRKEALLRSGAKRYWTVFLLEDPAHIKQVQSET